MCFTPQLQVALDVTGYEQKEVLGKNINMFIIRPFSDVHVSSF
jgi:hypothetical protein